MRSKRFVFAVVMIFAATVVGLALIALGFAGWADGRRAFFFAGVACLALSMLLRARVYYGRETEARAQQTQSGFRMRQAIRRSLFWALVVVALFLLAGGSLSSGAGPAILGASVLLFALLALSPRGRDARNEGSTGHPRD
jgi:hypothetical protein